MTGDYQGTRWNEKSGQRMKGFVCHADDENTAKDFQPEQNRIMIRFHKGYLAGTVEDGLERLYPKARGKVSYCESLGKRTMSKPKKWAEDKSVVEEILRCE